MGLDLEKLELESVVPFRTIQLLNMAIYSTLSIVFTALYFKYSSPKTPKFKNVHVAMYIDQVPILQSQFVEDLNGLVWIRF